MITTKPSKPFVSSQTKVIRLVLGIMILLGILCYTVFFSLAGFSGVAQNKNNKITTANMSMALLTTDKPINILPNASGQSSPAPLPQYIADLYANGNTLISIDDENNGNRKFFEYHGKGEITDIQPGFRQQRPLIVQNKSHAAIDYTIEFITREILNPGLSKVFFFHYIKVGDDIANEMMEATNKTQLSPQAMVENIGSPIQKIGNDKPIRIKANSTHIYIVDMGILSTAGNTVQGAGMLFDIVLSSTFVGKETDSVSSKLSSSGETLSSNPSSSHPTSSSVSSEASVSTPSVSSNSDPFFAYVDYHSILNSGSYSGGDGTASAPYVISNLQELKHFIEDSTTKNTWVTIRASLSNVKSIPSSVIDKKARIVVEEGVVLSNLDISATPPTNNPINPFQNCVFYYMGSSTTDYSLFMRNISYQGEFVS